MLATAPALTESLAAVAHAKLNLALHVTGRRPDGYHLLDMLVAFAEIGDRLAIRPGRHDDVSVDGPFAPALAGHDNILRPALALARAQAAAAGSAIGPLHIRLTKNLPVAAGIGGGSADAAALLRALSSRLPAAAARAIAARSVELGADIPMCMAGVPSLAAGIGDVLTPLAAFPRLPVVLINCGRPVSTPDMFRRLSERRQPPLPPVPAAGFADMGALLSYLSGVRNDLEPPARALLPEIGEGLAALSRRGAVLSRMSGSGATVFGLFADMRQAREAAHGLAAELPGWWVQASGLMPAGRDDRA